jgi:dihydropteroate synthase
VISAHISFLQTGVYKNFRMLSSIYMPNMKLKSTALKLQNRTLAWGAQTYIMGILNVTPDSFSGDGLLTAESPTATLDRIEVASVINKTLEVGRDFVSLGADILDVGGESTRPGSEPVSVKDELRIVIPVIKAIAGDLDVLISVDTYKAQVADAALQAGAHIVNDVWGLHADPGMGNVIARHDAAVILMHNRSSWAHAQVKERLGGRYIGMEYDNLLADIKRELMESVSVAQVAGIPDEHIIVDPGIGFGKTIAQNLELVDRLDEIRALGYPILFGPSRKSFIGYTLDLPPSQRLEGTAAAITIGIDRGADIVRVHDVDFMKRVSLMTDAIVRRPDTV